MKTLLAALLLLASAACFGASWDGTKGDFTISTAAVTPRNPTNAIRLTPQQTTIRVTCSNAAVSAVRIKIVFTNPANGFTGTIVKTFDLGPLRSAVVTLPVDESLITGAPQLTALFDGASIQF